MRNCLQASLLLLMMALLCGCDEKLARKEFEEQSENCICLTNNGSVVFNYDENDCQLCYMTQSVTFRVGKDDMSDYYQLECSEEPTEGNSLYADLTWTTADDIRTRKNLEFSVLRIDDYNTIWLWNPKHRIGAVVRKNN